LVYDVHYYLDNWVPIAKGADDQVHVVGGDFFGLPGQYLLPFHEGSYSVSGDGEVSFLPRGAGAPYMHPLVHYVQPTFKMPLGWYTVFWDFCHPSDFKVVRPAPLGYSTSHSIQTTFLERQVARISNTKTGASSLSNCFPAWTEKDTDLLLEAMVDSLDFRKADHRTTVWSLAEDPMEVTLSVKRWWHGTFLEGVMVRVWTPIASVGCCTPERSYVPPQYTARPQRGNLFSDTLARKRIRKEVGLGVTPLFHGKLSKEEHTRVYCGRGQEPFNEALIKEGDWIRALDVYDAAKPRQKKVKTSFLKLVPGG